MKRTISEITPAMDDEIEILDVVPAKRAANEARESTHADHLTRLIIHLRDMFGLMTQLDKTEQLCKTLHELYLETPLASVFGQQSSGKSSLLNSMYGNGENFLYAAHGLGTRCPLEIRIGPQYENVIYLISGDATVHYFDTLQAAQEHTRSANGLINAKIVMERCDKTMTTMIVDLPGANAHQDNKEYMLSLQPEYLQLQQSVILHVINANGDEDNDNSTEFVSGLENSIIKVYTHIDELKTQEQKETLLRRLKRDPRAAVVCNENELVYIRALKAAGYIPDHVHAGTAELRDHVTAFLHEKTEVLIPKYHAKIAEVVSLCEQGLLTLGHRTPDMSEKRYNFLRGLRERITSTFKLHNELHDEDEAVRGKISVKLLDKVIDTVPSIEKLTEELARASDGELPGSEGWGVAGKRYMATMCDKIMQDHIKPAIEGYTKLYTHALDIVYAQYPDTTFVLQALDALHTSAQAELKLAMDDIQADVEHQVEVIKSNPYSGALLTSGVHEASMTEHVNIFTHFLFKMSPEYVGKLFEVGPECAYNELMHRKIFLTKTSAYETQARVMHQTLRILWSKFSQDIHDDIVRLVRSRIGKLQERLFRLSDDVDRNLICETRENVQRRDLLNQLLKKCEEAEVELGLM